MLVESKCRSCGASVAWVKTEGNRSMPVDFKPDKEKGNIEIDNAGVAHYLSGNILEEAAQAGVELYLSHFATCPNAKQHRKAQ